MLKVFDGLSAEIKALSVVAFFVSLGFGVQAPATPVFANEIGAGSAAVGAMISAFAIARMISAWPFGKVMGGWGERRTLSAGMAVLAITSIGAGFSQTAWQLILFRGLSGVGSAAFSIAAMSLLLRTCSHDMRGRAIGLFMGGMNLGMVAGPAVGGMLLVLPVRWIFFIYGAVVALTGVLAMMIMSKDHPGTQSAAHPRVDTLTLWEALRSATFRAAIVSNFGMGWIVYGLRASVLPLLLLNVMHEDAKWVGISLAICAVVQVVLLPYAGKFTDVTGRRTPLIVGEVLLVISMVLLLVWPGLISYLMCMAVMGVGAAFCTTAASASLGDVTKGSGGTVVAFFQMTSDMGMVVGPLAAGLLAETSFDAAVMVSAFVAAWGVVMALLMPRLPPPAKA